jgi:hypothetical protein
MLMPSIQYKLYLPNKEDLRREIERQKELYLMAQLDKYDIKSPREHQTNIEKFISFLSPVYTFWAFYLFYSGKSRIFAITKKL